jgi:hypothetical protein
MIREADLALIYAKGAGKRRFAMFEASMYPESATV